MKTTNESRVTEFWNSLPEMSIVDIYVGESLYCNIQKCQTILKNGFLYLKESGKRLKVERIYKIMNPETNEIIF